MWQQHLFSKRVASPGAETVDEFHTLTEKIDGSYQAVEKILRRPNINQQRSVAFIQDMGDQLYIGVDGRVVDVLGGDCPFAYEMTKSRDGLVKGRPITFVQGYFAKKNGAVIPGLNSLLSEYPKHLEDVLQRANAGEEPVRATSVAFSPGRTSEATSDWDRIAKEFQEGKHFGKTATFTHTGKIFGSFEPAAASFAAKVLGESRLPKETGPLKIPSKLGFLPFAGITLGVMTAGWLVWELVKALSSQGQARN